MIVILLLFSIIDHTAALTRQPSIKTPFLMYINPSQYSQVFSDIKRTSSSHSTCKLILFVSCLSIDSICTAKILSLVLKKNLIQYQLIPVAGYADLKEHYLKLDPEVSNVILIGCGAMVDIESFFEIDPNDYVTSQDPMPLNHSQPLEEPDQGPSFSRKIYIMDGSRPWNLDNVFGSHMVVCFDDGYIDKNLAQERESFKVLVDASDHESSDESSGEESDEHEVIEDEDEEDIEDDGGVVTDDSGENRKRRLEEAENKKLRKQRRKELNASENVIETYYNQGTAVLTATTAIIYALLATIGETSIDNLWLSIIGASSLDRLHPEVYDKIQPLFLEEVHRLNPSNAGTERSADSTALSIEKDYHLFLLRHWTLYDSFFYSSLVNSKLNLWTEDGRKKLHKLFAKMGISLSVAQQKWLYMDISVKKNLPTIFNKYLPLYGLEGIVRDGFVRTFGFVGQLSAMECVEALVALLESDERISGDKNHDKDEDINEKIERKEKLWVNNFWSSWDALNMNNHGNASRIVSSNTNSLASALSSKKLKGYDLLMRGLEKAKDIQQIIFKTGMSVLERKLMKNLRLYRLCVLNDGSIPDLSMFNNPLILTKLGNWLLENINELEFLNLASKNDKSLSNALKPLVLASLDPASDTYLVIGLAPKYPRGLDNSAKAKIAQETKDRPHQHDSTFMTRLNTFSVAFQRVAASSDAKVRINSFESSIIEIRKDDLLPFLEKLTLSGLI